MTTAPTDSGKACAPPPPPRGPAKRRKIITNEMGIWIYAQATDMHKIPSADLNLAKEAIGLATKKFQLDLESDPALQTLATKHCCHLCFTEKAEVQHRWDANSEE